MHCCYAKLTVKGSAPSCKRERRFLFGKDQILGTASNIFRKFVLLFIIFFFSGYSIFAQEKISGKVTGNNDLGLPGVTVLIKGTKKATQTDTAGNYSINANKGESLVFSFVGRVTREVKVEGGTPINIVLAEQINNLNEVVVTGYVSEKVKDITGAVAIVKPKDLTAVPTGQVESMLQGRVAGMNVITQATPGANTLISIHGYGNFGDVAPLYIIDGIPGNINALNPDDIQSLQVLKDAGSAAIYGVRGANGVIVVTTRRGKQGNAAVNFESYFGYQVPVNNGYSLLNPQEMADATWKAYANSSQPLTHPQYGNGPSPVLPDYVLAGNMGGLSEGDPATNPDLYNIDPSAGDIYQIVKANKSGTDWLHALYKPAFSQNYTLTASGGGNKSSYLFSAGYLNQQGTLINTYLKRFTIRINTEFNILNNIRIGENVQLSSRETPDYDGVGNPGQQSASYTLSNPILPLYDIKGNNVYGAPPGLGYPGPIQGLEDTKRSKRYIWTALGNVYAEFDFAKHFTFRTNFGGTFNYEYYYFYLPRYITYSGIIPNSLAEGSGYNRSWSWQNTLVFNKIIDEDHRIKALIGTEYISSYGRGLSGNRVNFYSDDPNYSYLSNGGVEGQNNGSQAFNSSLFSIFGLVNYGYKDKYLLNVTIRQDGSSVFGSENRYGFFPSIGAAWRISKENFATSITWLTDLKLRGSWGKLGFDGNTPRTNQFSLFGGDPSSSFYSITGNNTSATQGFRAINLGNPKTGWQADIQTNIGLDAIFWNNKLSFSADWYIKKTTGLLFPLSLPYLLGGATAPYVNVGDIENAGFDLLLGSRGNIGKDLKFDITVTFTTYANKIVKLNEGQLYFDQGASRNEVGHPVSSFYGYKIIGFFNSVDDIAKSPKQDEASPGRFKYLDADGTGKITDSDRVFFGNPNPKFTLGLNIALNFRNFDFSTLFYGSFGNDLINAVKLSTDFFNGGGGAKSTTLLYDSWSPTHMQAKVAINENLTNFSNIAVANSYPLEDGSYFKNKSMILGYTIDRRTIQKIKLKQIRIYFQVTNLFTITGYTGLDPETGGNPSSFGVDYGNYPNNQKQWLVGLNVDF